MNLQFYKYQGTGNDFIMVDNRFDLYNLGSLQIKQLCDRRFGIGADGLIELRMQPDYDFKMVYYNADGSESSMCGNGGRCLVAFAQQMGIKGPTYRFIAIDGEHQAAILPNGLVRLKMVDVLTIAHFEDHDVLNTGSPHYVKPVANLKAYPVFQEGRRIRNEAPYHAAGINVNFTERTKEGTLKVRTYERGVEDETYSCGTGVTAAALAQPDNQVGFNKISIETLGGNLTVEFQQQSSGSFHEIWLTGPAIPVFEGMVQI